MCVDVRRRGTAKVQGAGRGGGEGIFDSPISREEGFFTTASPDEEEEGSQIAPVTTCRGAAREEGRLAGECVGGWVGEEEGRAALQYSKDEQDDRPTRAARVVVRAQKEEEGEDVIETEGKADRATPCCVSGRAGAAERPRLEAGRP